MKLRAWVWLAVVAGPLLVAAVVLAFTPWAPTLDMAMTEFRVRDVGTTDTPLIGLPGRIGDFPDQGSHPGPWSFYLIAPFYWLTGRRAWGLELGSVVVNVAALGVALWLGHRLHRIQGVVLVAAVAAVAVRGYGLSVLTHPWNPYFPVLVWLVVLLATWLVVRGDHAVLPVVVVAASIAAQTHIPYLLNGIAMCALAFAALFWRRRRFDVDTEPDERRASLRSVWWALGLGFVVWLPPFVDELIHSPGNITMIVEHFTGEPSEEPIAMGDAVTVFFRHLDAFALVPDLVVELDAFVHRSGLPGGLGLGGMVVCVAWLGAAWWARRHRHSTLNALNVVVGVAWIVQALSISRIFGKVWYYLTLWAWSTTLLAVVSIGWTLYLIVRERVGDRWGPPTRRAVTVLGVVVATFTVLSLTAVASIDVPDPQLSDPLHEAVPDVADAIDQGLGAAVGADGTYVVFWQDALFIGSQGYGLVNELERRGYDVGVHPTWRVPVTHHRVLQFGEYDAEVHLVTGKFIEEWRARDGFVEVATVDQRTDEERHRFRELHERVVERLQEEGRDELVPVVSENLFGASLDLELPQDIIDDMSEMIEIGLPLAVFIAPIGNSF